VNEIKLARLEGSFSTGVSLLGGLGGEYEKKKKKNSRQDGIQGAETVAMSKRRGKDLSKKKDREEKKNRSVV